MGLRAPQAQKTMEIDPRVLPDSQNEEKVQEPQIPERVQTLAEAPAGMLQQQQSADDTNVSEESLNIDDLKRKAEVSSQNFERAKKAELEVKELRKQLLEKSSEGGESLEPEYLTDDEMTRKELGELKKELSSFKENQTLERLGNLYPAIKDKQEEFNEFRMEYPGIDMEKVAKIFITEKGYVEQLKPRIGLEKPTGGQKANLKPGITTDEIKRLRETQPRRYEQMLRSGKLSPADFV